MVGSVGLEGREGRGLGGGIEGLQIRVGGRSVGRSRGRSGDGIGILGIRRVGRGIAGVIGGAVAGGERRSGGVGAGGEIGGGVRVRVLGVRRVGIIGNGTVIALLHADERERRNERER